MKETGNRDMPRSFNSWRANIRPTEDVKQKRERARMEMERILAKRKAAN